MPARTREVLKAVLFEVLLQHPEGLRIHDAYDTVASICEFPADWHRQIPMTAGYEELTRRGYSNWRDIPQETLVTLVSTEPQWQNEMRWSRNALREAGLLDGAAPRGVWRLTDRGLRTSKESLLIGLNSDEQRIVRTRRPQPQTPTPPPPKPTESHPPTTLRQSLERKLETLTSSMPLEDLELLVELARVVRTRSITNAA